MYDLDFVLDDKIHICFYNNVTNKLEKIEHNTKIPIDVFESHNRRFYIVYKHFNNKLFNIHVSLSGFNKHGYSVSIECNKDFGLNLNNNNFCSFIIDDINPTKYTNIVPLDIRVTSLTSSVLNTALDIDVSYYNI